MNYSTIDSDPRHPRSRRRRAMTNAAIDLKQPNEVIDAVSLLLGDFELGEWVPSPEEAAELAELAAKAVRKVRRRARAMAKASVTAPVAKAKASEEPRPRPANVTCLAERRAAMAKRPTMPCPAVPPPPASDPPSPVVDATPPKSPRGDHGAVLAAVRKREREGTRLAFVPAVLRELAQSMGREAAQRALLAAGDAGALELRPESGMGRLTADDAAWCPPGPQGSVLSWCRRPQ